MDTNLQQYRDKFERIRIEFLDTYNKLRSELSEKETLKRNELAKNNQAIQQMRDEADRLDAYIMEAKTSVLPEIERKSKDLTLTIG